MERDIVSTNLYRRRRRSQRSADGADSLFSRTYWRARVQQVSATRGLTPQQRARLERLFESLPFPVLGEE
ncbi:hypothetical protein FVF58_40815 [Paraburkholderia panacisoli]|uniref:Uncharacterized protein n=1 Tax=Paraburkholderia panacisoli TaxID=2603818 RepID=A0A5B0G927_9BURK|nr:hypothetical protein FVF58_40815 [Paraburkholderia panacisoli]